MNIFFFMQETHVMKDNPTFSMITESDEETEAMLQPETEDSDKMSRKPLVNLGHDDDSD